MARKRKVEIFTAGCYICEETEQMVRRIACEDYEVDVLNLSDEKVAERARDLGIRCIPAVAVDGKLASCCVGTGVNEEALLNAGIGQSK